MNYKVTHTTRYSYSDPVPVCHNQVRLTPRQGPFQRCIDHRLLINPTPPDLSERMDYFGNKLQYFSIHEAHSSLTVTSTTRVVVEPRLLPNAEASPGWEQVVEMLRQDRSPKGLYAFQFAFASPHVGTNEQLAAYARQSFTAGRPILQAACELTGRIYRDFKYDTRATNVNTPWEEVFRQRRGVCQDFTHVQLGCLRSLGLAARYVSGYLRTAPPEGKPRLVGADASHAWVSLYCGELGWVDLDPTNNLLPNTDHITLAYGRDYSDVSPIKGVFVGGGQHGMSVSVDVSPSE